MMKKYLKEERISRRDFLRQSACASLGVVGLVNALAHLRLMSAAMAQGGMPDYKALVCIFLNGGNDSNNMLVPRGDPASDALRKDYETGRGILAIPRASLHALNVPADSRAFVIYHGGVVPQMGVHPSAPALAELFNAGDLAFIANVGTLAYPIANRSEYVNGSVPVPPQLFSHSDQQLQWQSSVPDKPFASGWGGRVADLLHASYNQPASSISMSISIAGINSFQVGTSGEVIQYALSPTGTIALSGYGTNYANALDTGSTFTSPQYKNSDTGRRLKAFEDIVRLAHESLLEDEYNKVIIRGRETEGAVGAAVLAAQSTGVDFDGIFTAAGATTSLGNQLKMAAKIIAGREPLGNQRQIFFCQVGGYDTHQGMLGAHANLMAELSNSLKAFRDVLSHPGINAWDKTVAFTASDFNRTLTPNGTDTGAGSDHAWAGHAIVAGGAVAGGNIYGHFPPLKTGNAAGSIDSHTTRGRFIPSVSVDQYSAVLAKWLGAESSAIDAIFPNLSRFDSPFLSSTPNLGFL